MPTGLGDEAAHISKHSLDDHEAASSPDCIMWECWHDVEQRKVGVVCATWFINFANVRFNF